jgi:hypothetical protein
MADSAESAVENDAMKSPYVVEVAGFVEVVGVAMVAGGGVVRTLLMESKSVRISTSCSSVANCAN